MDSGPPCSDLDGHRDWLFGLVEACRPPSAQHSPSDLFGSCSWVTCDCIWHASRSAVHAREHRQCFTQNLLLERLPLETQWLVAALGKMCRAHVDALARPCGRCDRFRGHRECGGLETLSGASVSGAHQGQGLHRGAFSVLLDAAK